MTRKLLCIATALLATLTTDAQTSEPKDNSYLVWTNTLLLNKEGNDSTATEEDAELAHLNFMDKYFRFITMCDWQEGMRFMVIPDKKDMVIRTFADSLTGELVPSMTLRHKIMEYRGHSHDGGLHERVHFKCLDDGKSYYYEVPSARFDDYCYAKYGVPTLAYLGDVDAAREQLVGKTLLTKYPTYNVDVSATSYGAHKITVPENTMVTVVRAGVGTRNYPVKLIVADKSGREFFQTLALSHINCGMRDEEFEEDDNIKHTFAGSFEMMSETKMSEQYKQYIDKEVFTLYSTLMSRGHESIEIPRLTTFTIKGIEEIIGDGHVRLSLEREGQMYYKIVTFKNENSGFSSQREDFYHSLFASGNIAAVKGVRESNMADIQKSIVRNGFNEAEVKLALGEPTARTKVNKGLYTWEYRGELGKNRYTVYFDAKNKTVKHVEK